MFFSCGRGFIKCTKLLFEHKVKCDLVDCDGRTPLIYAAAKGNVECVKLLLKNGANVNAKDKDDNTPLTVACKENRVECLKYLIINGADYRLKDMEIKPLWLCAFLGHFKCFILLLEAGASLKE